MAKINHQVGMRYTAHWAQYGGRRIALVGHACYRGALPACLDWIEARAEVVAALSIDPTWAALFPDAPEWAPGGALSAAAYDLAMNLRPVVAAAGQTYVACVTEPETVLDESITVTYDHANGVLAVVQLRHRYLIEVLDPHAAVAKRLCRVYL